MINPTCGRSLMVELQLPKLLARVRFPSSAPIERHSGYKDSWLRREVSRVAFSGSIPVTRSIRTLIWIQEIRVGVLRVFPGIPGFLGLPGVAGGCPRVAFRGPSGVFGPVSDAWANRSSKSAGHRQKVSMVTRHMEITSAEPCAGRCPPGCTTVCWRSVAVIEPGGLGLI